MSHIDVYIINLLSCVLRCKLTNEREDCGQMKSVDNHVYLILFQVLEKIIIRTMPEINFNSLKDKALDVDPDFRFYGIRRL